RRDRRDLQGLAARPAHRNPRNRSWHVSDASGAGEPCHCRVSRASGRRRASWNDPLNRFDGRTALVTGASRGIGAAVAIGAQVDALGRRALLAQADLTDASSVSVMVQTI